MANWTMHPIWGLGMRALRRSLYANQVLSSIVHEWTIIDNLQVATASSGICTAVDDSGSRRNAAVGHMIRLHFVPAAVTDEVDRLTRLVVKELSEIRLADEMVDGILHALVSSGELPDSWYQLAALWSGEQRRYLRISKRALKDVVDSDVWASGKQAAKRAQTTDRD